MIDSAAPNFLSFKKLGFLICSSLILFPNNPLFEIEDLDTYADDNYMGEENKNVQEAIRKIIAKTERVMKWMSSFGLKINESKTELCIFHRRQSITVDVIIDNTNLTSKDTINFLGIV